jgi:1L-myo-inositol 1-phosphate cytidylyltransferase
MKGVVLAAGDGGRLRPRTQFTSKVLLEVGGQPLIHYPIEALRLAGITDIAVVVGYLGDSVRNALHAVYPRITIIENEQYEEGLALSVLAARSFVMDDPFVLCMGDHPISPDIPRSVLSNGYTECVLCVDWGARLSCQVNDGTRVLVDSNGYISAIGKRLDRWNAMDTGVFRMTTDVFTAIDHLVHRQGASVSVSDVVRYLGLNGQPFATCDVSGTFWGDVDTAEDYHSIDSLLREKNGEPL